MQHGDSAPQPVFVGAFSRTGTGSWFAGAVPSGARTAGKPVLVFVPGLGQPASSWWGEDEFYGHNDMYARAYADGFRTAFVGFAPPGTKAMDMWQNGRILAWQLSDICRYFHVPAVTVVCHSKGGVDAETAAAWFGAAPLTAQLITLSSPHWGSQLADLAYSSFGWHLAELVGAHSNGCYVMQTEYMAEFRRLTQGRPEPNSFETFAGRAGGPPLSKLWAGGIVMERFGPNDCVVTVQSAQNSRARHIMTLDFNHSQMRMGRFIWPWVRYAAVGVPVEQSQAVPAGAVPAQAAPLSLACRGCGQIIRGGPLTRGLDESFLIDSTVTQAELTVMVAHGRAPVLTGPDGNPAGPFEAARGRDGAVRYTRRVERPAPGKWTLKAPAGTGAYLALLRLYGAPAVPEETAVPPVGNLRQRVRVLRTLPGRIETVAEYEAAGGALPAAFAAEEVSDMTQAMGTVPELPKLGGGLYSLEATLTGELTDGSPYQRTLQRSLLVRPDHANAKDFLTAFYTDGKPRRV